MFVRTVSEAEAEGLVARLYEQIRADVEQNVALVAHDGAAVEARASALLSAADGDSLASVVAEVPDPDRIASLVPAHLAYTVGLRSAGFSAEWAEQDVIPSILPNFAVAAFSSCSYCTEGIAALLLLQGMSVADLDAILADYRNARLPPAQETVLGWLETYTRRPWALTRDDLDQLRRVGLTDAQIVTMVGSCGSQTWFTKHADGGGAQMPASFPGFLHGTEWHSGRDVAGDVHSDLPVMRVAGAPAPGVATMTASDTVAWVECDVPSTAFADVSARASGRYGFVPNVLRATSACPTHLGVRLSGLELLERSQSGVLSAREHALVRAVTVRLDRARYFSTTIEALLDANSIPNEVLDDERDPMEAAWDERSRLLVAFTTKLATASFKVIEKDVQRFRDAGIPDEGYVDVLGTVANQTLFDRTTHALGVRPDSQPLLAS